MTHCREREIKQMNLCNDRKKMKKKAAREVEEPKKASATSEKERSLSKAYPCSQSTYPELTDVELSLLQAALFDY